MNIENSWSCYCGEKSSVMFSAVINEIPHEPLNEAKCHFKVHLLSFCLKASSSNILLSVASTSGSLELQQTQQ